MNDAQLIEQLRQALNTEPWHFTGTYDVERCFWCSSERYGAYRRLEWQHDKSCEWARLSPHPDAVKWREAWQAIDAVDPVDHST